MGPCVSNMSRRGGKFVGSFFSTILRSSNLEGPLPRRRQGHGPKGAAVAAKI